MSNLATKGAPSPRKLPLFTHQVVVEIIVALILFLIASVHRNDYLRIADGSNNTIGTYCGNHTGKSVRVVGSVALLTFHSDGSVQKRGFELSFSFFRQSAGELSMIVSLCCIDVFLLLLIRDSITTCFLSRVQHQKGV